MGDLLSKSMFDSEGKFIHIIHFGATRQTIEIIQDDIICRLFTLIFKDEFGFGMKHYH